MCVTDNGQLNMFILFNIIKCFDKIDFTPKQLHCHEEKLKVIIITNNTLLKSYKSCTQNFSKIFIKRKRQYQFWQNPFGIRNSKKSHRVVKKKTSQKSQWTTLTSMH